MANHQECMRLSVRKHFGDAGVEELERLVSRKYRADGLQHNMKLKSFVEVLPQGAVFLLAGLKRLAGADAGKLLDANAFATVRALMILPRWTAEAGSAFGRHLLHVQEAEFKLLASPGDDDIAALRFLGGVLEKNMSASEVDAALQEAAEGQRCMRTFKTSRTLGAVVMYAAWSALDNGKIEDWTDEVWDWLKGAAQWVVHAVEHFEEWACKQAKAVVDSVFCEFENPAEILEHIPGVGLVVAGIYAMAGKRDEATATLATNVNAIVTLICASVGFCMGMSVGSMAGAALGKAVGLLIQEAIAQAIEDPKLKAEVGDISAAQFIVEVALTGAAYGGALGIAEQLAGALGMNAIETVATSSGLNMLLSKLPEYFAEKAFGFVPK